MFCPKCGYELGNDTERKFCPQCGAEVDRRSKTKIIDKKTKTIIFLRRIVIGYIALNLIFYIWIRPILVIKNNEVQFSHRQIIDVLDENFVIAKFVLPALVLESIGENKVKEIIIPEGITKIADNGFSDCRSLTNIELPFGIIEIRESAFSNCTSLTSIEIPSSVIEIGNEAFYNCENITDIELPSDLRKIGSNAFSSCTSLTSVLIPSNVTEIGGGAFYGCINAEIKLPGYMQEWDVSDFIDEETKYSFY